MPRQAVGGFRAASKQSKSDYSMKKIVSAILLYCLFASGCVLRSGGSGSFDGFSDVYGADAQALAAQAADELGLRHAPAHTSLTLQRVPGLFGDALENHLRAKGFVLATSDVNGTRSSIGVKYRLDALEDTQEGGALGYVQISCTDGQIFSFSRTLSEAAPYTEPPHTRSVPDEHPLESRPLPEGTAIVPAHNMVPTVAYAPSTPTARTAPVRSKATAAVVARRSGIRVANFCRWNDVTPDTILAKDHTVYLSEPPVPVASCTASVGIPVAAHVPLPSAPSASVAPAPEPAPVVLPTRAQTSPALTLESSKSVEIAPRKPASAPLPVAASMPTATPASALAPAVPAASAPSVLTEPASSLAVPAAMTLPTSTDAAPMPDLLPDLPPWEITKGQMLRGQMEGWAAVAGYSLIWNAHNDYEMQSSAAFTGEFIEAVKTFFAALQANGLALRVTIYQGNKVMEVSQH